MSKRLIEKRNLLKRKHEQIDQLNAEIEELKKVKTCLSNITKTLNEHLSKTVKGIKSNFFDFIHNIDVISKNAYSSRSFHEKVVIFSIDNGECLFNEESFSGSWFVELAQTGDCITFYLLHVLENEEVAYYPIYTSLKSALFEQQDPETFKENMHVFDNVLDIHEHYEFDVFITLVFEIVKRFINSQVDSSSYIGLEELSFLKSKIQ